MLSTLPGSEPDIILKFTGFSIEGDFSVTSVKVFILIVLEREPERKRKGIALKGKASLTNG